MSAHSDVPGRCAAFDPRCPSCAAVQRGEVLTAAGLLVPATAVPPQPCEHGRPASSCTECIRVKAKAANRKEQYVQRCRHCLEPIRVTYPTIQKYCSKACRKAERHRGKERPR